jgi:cation diffusion facilitator family transporter
MAAHCCEDKACEVAALRERHGAVLKIVLAINATMFIIEVVAGLLAQSTALLADALDMFGDALVYGFSLYVIARNGRWKAAAALLKGTIMGAFGLAVLGEAVYKVFSPTVPRADVIGAIGVLALLANVACLILLWRHRTDDINMQSTWLCSRNDVLANLGVLVAAIGVRVFHAGWPDLLIGTVIASLFLASAVRVTRQALREFHTVYV